ncbi:MAG: hypothetical protein WCC28_21720 [Mycobacterium sp.]|uniref:hypothetical protein n=1 Tax=Mycobacterium sp. TaxID=1785 RepID=UPI003C7701B5
MQNVAASVEPQANRFDRERRLPIGLGCAVLAVSCLIILIWLLYTATTFALSLGPLLFQFALCAVIGVIAVIEVARFLGR